MYSDGVVGTTSTVYIGAALASVWSFVVLLPSLAVTVRRLRDTGRQWQNIFWILVPIAGLIILIVWLSEPTKVEFAPPAAVEPAK